MSLGKVLIQNTQEIKRTLFNWTKQDKTCKFLRKSSFSSYVQHKNRKRNSSTYFVSAECGRLAEAILINPLHTGSFSLLQTVYLPLEARHNQVFSIQYPHHPCSTCSFWSLPFLKNVIILYVVPLLQKGLVTISCKTGGL